MPRGQRRTGWIAWRNSEAKEILLEDLARGFLPFGEADCPADMAWAYYKQKAAFSSVQFDQFKERLKDHRAQQNQLKKDAMSDAAALEHDEKLYPRKMKNQRGEPVFDLSPAKLLLREDVAAKKHTTMTTEFFRRSRSEYMVFKLDIFRARIKQEERRQKYLFHLELQRVEKAKKRQQQASLTATTTR